MRCITGHRRGAALAAFLALCLLAAAAPRTSSLEVRRDERLFVIAPHPDDETLGAGGLIARVLGTGGTARVILVTAGDGYVQAVATETGRPRPDSAEFVAYGQRRIAEARCAVHALGGPRLQLLGFPDGGLTDLLSAHWLRRHPARSATTGADRPPYPEALHQGIEYDGADLRAELVQLMREGQPTIIALPDPLDRHPDHRAAALFTLLALQDWMSEGHRLPRLVAYLVHWPDWPPGWDDKNAPSSARRRRLDLPADLRERGLERVVLALDDRQIESKFAALTCYKTQQHMMGPVLSAFVRRTEPFTLLTEAVVQDADEEVARQLGAPPPDTR